MEKLIKDFNNDFDQKEEYIFDVLREKESQYSKDKQQLDQYRLDIIQYNREIEVALC